MNGMRYFIIVLAIMLVILIFLKNTGVIGPTQEEKLAIEEDWAEKRLNDMKNDIHDIRLDDGTRCVVFHERLYAGGITCDWNSGDKND